MKTQSNIPKLTVDKDNPIWVYAWDEGYRSSEAVRVLISATENGGCLTVNPDALESVLKTGVVEYEDFECWERYEITEQNGKGTHRPFKNYNEFRK